MVLAKNHPDHICISRQAAEVMLSRQPLSVLRPVMNRLTNFCYSTFCVLFFSNFNSSLIYVNTGQVNDKEWDELSSLFFSKYSGYSGPSEVKMEFLPGFSISTEGTEGLLDWS